MARTKNSTLEKTRKICLSFPDTKETLTWDEPHFRVGEKIFCGCGKSNDNSVIGFKMEKPDQAVLIKLPGCSIAPYVGRHGWVSVDTAIFDDWAEIANLIEGSFRLIAPKRTVKQMDAEDQSSRPVSKPAKKRAAKKKPSP
jgi:predicted DNA-binding protein (MmcQ/YjbR family)